MQQNYLLLSPFESFLLVILKMCHQIQNQLEIIFSWNKYTYVNELNVHGDFQNKSPNEP